MNPASAAALEATGNLMTAATYSPRTITLYLYEIRTFFLYFSKLPPDDIGEEEIIEYMIYMREERHVSRSKCRTFAHSIAFFYRHILRKPFELPSKLYPRREFKLPVVLTKEEIKKLLSSCENLRQRCIIELFYSSGIRLQEFRWLKIIDVEASHNRIRITNGKGDRERFTVLSRKCFESLRSYYKISKPKIYLFERKIPGQPLNSRNIYSIVRKVYDLAGLSHKKHKVHALRHSFATHMLDNGINVNTIRELLGHSSLVSTMIYLHMQKSKISSITSPLDSLFEQPFNQFDLYNTRRPYCCNCQQGRFKMQGLVSKPLTNPQFS